MDYIAGLNEPQREAVLHSDGAIMIIAGAGAGKTRVLTHRIAHLMQNGVEGHQILALTFTNKAAGEMRHRIQQIAGDGAKSIWMGTFHSIFARILRIEADRLNYTSSFSIYDTEDSRNLLKSIIKERNLDEKNYKPASVLGRISLMKNRLISYKEYGSNPTYYEDDRASQRPEMGNLYELYQRRAYKANAMDFDDLLFNTNILLRDFPEVREKYQRKFRYILIDEFQDTNLSQYLIVKQLADMHGNICVVGDDAQSIYAFRGADIENILNFQRDYPNAKVIRLEQNYRSTANIVHAANSLIAKNKNQLDKNVWTSNEDGLPVQLIKTVSDTEEARWVSDKIFEDKMNQGLRNKDFAILYRTNAQSRSFEEALRKKNIKYRIIGGLSFYQRKEIKDLISYLRFTINHNDEEALKRIINLPKRGIGDTTVDKLRQLAEHHALSLWQVVSDVRSYVQGRSSTSIEGFADLIREFEGWLTTKDAYHTANDIANKSGLLKELYEDKSIEGLSRYENVQELLNGIKAYVDNPENEDKSLAAFLQEVSLLTNADEEEDGDDDKITLMTIHGSKGLEFPAVFVVGMEENLFPSAMMLGSLKDLEEERRLFYVAITRAQKNLYLTYTTTRYVFGRLQNYELSRFIDEINPKYLQKNNEKVQKETSFSTLKSLVGGTNRITNNYTKIASTKTTDTNFTPSPASLVVEGARVEHGKFGTGIVKKVENLHGDKKAIIAFDEVGEKTLLLSFAKLKVL
jgi:DNA helicase-2/ATP-dependent DNA helicase PcrA